MTTKEFLEKMKVKYRDTTELDLEDLAKWIMYQSMTENELDRLYTQLSRRYKYKTFPPLSEIIDIYELSSPHRYDGDDPVIEYCRHIDELRDQWLAMGISEKIDKVKSIRSKIDSGQKPTLDEIEFMHIYDGLYYGHCQRNG